MNYFTKSFREKITIFNLILCFVMPPVGILFLLVSGFISMYRNYKMKLYRFKSTSFIFFLSLIISSVGSSIELKNPIYSLMALIIIGYWGLYLRIDYKNSSLTFQQYRFVMIFGAVYSCFVGWTVKWMHFSLVEGFLTGTVMFDDPTTKDYSRLIGIAYNPNFNMYLLLLSLAFLLVEMMYSLQKRLFKNIAWQMLIVIILSKGIYDTGSRSAFAIMLFLYLLFFLRWSKMAFAFIAITFGIEYKRLFGLMPRSGFIDPSMNTRELIWQNSFKLWRKHPVFGATSYGFPQEFAKFLQQNYKKIPSALINVPHSHDMFLGILSEYGIVGEMAFLLVLVVNIYQYIRMFFAKKKRFVEPFIFSLPVVVLTGIFDEPNYSPQIAIFTIFLLGFWNRYANKKTI